MIHDGLAVLAHHSVDAMLIQSMDTEIYRDVLGRLPCLLDLLDFVALRSMYAFGLFKLNAIISG